MKTMRDVTLSTTILAALLFAGAPARAQNTQQTGRSWRLTGVIDRIDRAARTLAVREIETGREVIVIIDNGSGVRLRDGFLSSYPRTIPFEMALVGMQVDLRVAPSGRAERD